MTVFHTPKELCGLSVTEKAGIIVTRINAPLYAGGRYARLQTEEETAWPGRTKETHLAGNTGLNIRNASAFLSL